MDHLTVPFSVTIMTQATPLTRLDILVVGPTKSLLLVVMQAEQQLLIMMGMLSKSKGADAADRTPERAARRVFC